MPRPRKCRRICTAPGYTEFTPSGGAADQMVRMELDEYEAVRLIDLEGMTQEQCAGQMAVARTTVQTIYTSARRKLAECIVHGRRLQIGGGDVQLCEHRGQSCGRGCCQAGCKTDKTKGEENKYE